MKKLSAEQLMSAQAEADSTLQTLFDVLDDRPDMQEAIRHCLRFDHLGLTCRHKGRDFRLTDVTGKVIKDRLCRSMNVA